MQPWVREKLDRIDELFPPERIERSKERWRRLYAGEPALERMPFYWAPALLNYYNDNHDPAGRLRIMHDECVLHGAFQDDFIPAIFPGCKTSTIPSLFGAREIVVNCDHSCEPLIQTTDDIAHLPEPQARPGTPARGWIDMQRYLVEETEGRIPIHVADMQGPPDACGKIRNYEDFFKIEGDRGRDRGTAH